MKKTLSLVLALIMVMALAVPAFAAGGASTDPYSKTTEVAGTTKVPTVNVTIPTSAAITVNPYKMSVDVSADQDGSDMKNDQIISPVQYVKNESDVAIALDVSITGKVEGEAVFATAPVTDKILTKSAFVYFEIKAATAEDGTGDPTWATAYDSKATDQVLLAAKAVVKKDVAKLGKGDETPTYAAFRLNGNVADKSTKPWASTDKVSATIAFTIKPAIAEASSGS